MAEASISEVVLSAMDGGTAAVDKPEFGVSRPAKRSARLFKVIASRCIPAN